MQNIEKDTERELNGEAMGWGFHWESGERRIRTEEIKAYPFFSSTITC